LTWRTGDGGTALVFILFHQAILAHWFDEGAHPAQKDIVVNYLIEQRVLNDFIEDLAFSPLYHLASPLLLPSSVGKLDREKETTCRR
jgi:hypothetical protein